MLYIWVLSVLHGFNFAIFLCVLQLSGCATLRTAAFTACMGMTHVISEHCQIFIQVVLLWMTWMTPHGSEMLEVVILYKLVDQKHKNQTRLPSLNSEMCGWCYWRSERMHIRIPKNTGYMRMCRMNSCGRFIPAAICLYVEEKKEQMFCLLIEDVLYNMCATVFLVSKALLSFFFLFRAVTM